MRNFNYSEIRNQKWDSDILGFIVAIYKEAGKQLPCTRPWQAEILIAMLLLLRVLRWFGNQLQSFIKSAATVHPASSNGQFFQFFF